MSLKDYINIKRLMTKLSNFFDRNYNELEETAGQLLNEQDATLLFDVAPLFLSSCLTFFVHRGSVFLSRKIEC